MSVFFSLVSSAMSPHSVPVNDRSDGRPRLLPSLIDQIAKKTPSQVVFSIPRTSNVSDGWVDVLFEKLANAINRIAHNIVRDLGPAPEGAWPTIGYLGSNEIRYFLYLVGAIKAGYKVGVLSVD